MAYLNYEQLAADLEVLAQVADRFGIALQQRPLIDDTSYFGGGTDEAFEPKQYPPIGPEDLEFIRENLDWELEASIGYEWPGNV